MRLALLNLFLNSLPVSLERPLNCICTYGRIKVNVFMEKNVDHIHNYVQKSFSTAWKVSTCEVLSGSYFPAIGLNTVTYSVYLRIQSECRKMRVRKNSVFGHFSRSVRLKFCLGLLLSFFLIFYKICLEKTCL